MLTGCGRLSWHAWPLMVHAEKEGIEVLEVWFGIGRCSNTSLCTLCLAGRCLCLRSALPGRVDDTLTASVTHCACDPSLCPHRLTLSVGGLSFAVWCWA